MYNKKDCKFCQIFKENKDIIDKFKFTFFIKDTNPKYKNHLLAISNIHIKDFNVLLKNKKNTFNYLKEIKQFTKKNNIKSFRIVNNIGSFQSIRHIHFHIHYD